MKTRTNRALPVNLYYWRDKTGHEIDIIVDEAGKLLPMEIKSGKTANTEFFKNLEYYKRLSGTKKSMLLYGGMQTEKRSGGTELMNWRAIAEKEI